MSKEKKTSRLLSPKKVIGKKIAEDPMNLIMEMAGRDAPNSNFKGKNLRGAVYDGYNLMGSNFENCDMTGSSFTDCDLTGCNFTNAIMDNIDLSESDLDKSIFINVKMKKGVLKYAKLRECDLTNADFDDSNFTSALLDNSTLINTSFDNTIMIGSSIKRFRTDENRKVTKTASFINSVMSGILLNGGAEYNTIVLNGAVLTSSRLDHLFIDGNLTDCDFSKAIIDNCVFQGTDLINTNFSDATIIDSKFQNFILKNVKFYRTKLSEVMFDNVTLDNCVFNKLKIDGTAIFDGVRIINTKFKYCREFSMIFNGIRSKIKNSSFTDFIGSITNLVKNTKIDKCIFKDTDLKFNLKETVVIRCDFFNINLKRSVFRICNIVNCHFEDVEHLENIFKHNLIKDTTFKNVKFIGSKFIDNKYEGVIFEDVDQDGANMDKGFKELMGIKEEKPLVIKTKKEESSTSS